MTLEKLKNKKILITGFGVEGQSTMRFLNTMLPNQCTIETTDQKDGADYLLKQVYYDLVIRSPGIPKKNISQQYTTATNIFLANAKGTIVGVTGSKGKSTTASLIYAFLKEAGLPAYLVGNIGNPMLDALLESNTPSDIFITEFSSYQLDDIQYSPHISVILNLFPEHMDYHNGIRNYWDAKKRIIARAGAEDYFIFNPDYPELRELAKTTKAKAMPFLEEIPFSTEDTQLKGVHNTDNIRAAATAALLFNIPYDIVKNALKKFKPLPHRMELVGTFNGITFYDDAISTAPESTIAAIKSFTGIETILLGGKDRGYDFTELAHIIIGQKISNVVLFPDSGANILKELQKTGKKLPNILETANMKEAVQFAYHHSPPHSTCLLSTASPSYSIWKNYEEKGNLFQAQVKQLGL